MKRNGLKYLLTLSTTLIAGCAAAFSIWGIGKLFSGAPYETMFMAAALELGKIVIVTFLYRYWSQIRTFLRTYLVLGALLLMIITSGGIYGYLSSAYATAALGFQSQRAEVTLVETQQTTLTSTYQSGLERIKNNDTRVNQLQQYRTQQESRLDSLVGRNGFITQQSMVRQADNDIRALQAESRTIEASNRDLLAQRDSLESVKLLKETETNTNSKLGSFWYIAQTLGVPLDTVVKWFVLIIVLVFDPLAISLVIAYNVIKKTEEEDELKKNTESNGPPNETDPTEHREPQPEPTPVIPVDVPQQSASEDIEDEIVPDDKTTEPEVDELKFEEELSIETVSDNMDLIETIDPILSLPYYMRPGFDWENDRRWVSDSEARAFHEARRR